jgi:glycosyl transferase family 25
MKIYAINLPQCAERRENIVRECARFGLEMEIVPGIYGRNLTPEQMRALVFEPETNPLGRSEIGCTLSHLAAYRKMLSDGIPMALVLEDDSVFASDPRSVLAALEDCPVDGPDVYMLTHRNVSYIRNAGPKTIGGYRFHRGWNAFGGNGYVVTGRAAENILRFQTPVKIMCDDWKLFLMNEAVRLFICEKQVVGLQPVLARDSSLEGDRLAVGRKRRIFFRHVRKLVPFRLRAKYLVRKLWHWRSICRQPG